MVHETSWFWAWVRATGLLRKAPLGDGRLGFFEHKLAKLLSAIVPGKRNCFSCKLHPKKENITNCDYVGSVGLQQRTSGVPKKRSSVPADIYIDWQCWCSCGSWWLVQFRPQDNNKWKQQTQKMECWGRLHRHVSTSKHFNRGTGNLKLM